MISTNSGYNATNTHIHPRTVNWFGIFSVAMGGCNQSLFLIGALIAGQGSIPGQGSAAVLLLIVGLLLSWAATPGWTELVMMYPNRVGGISATCAEAFKPYSPILANLTGVCYWWGWVPTCGITALLAASALHQWYLPWMPIPFIGICLILFFTFINLCGIKWAMRLAMPIAVLSGGLAFLSAIIPIYSGKVDWHQAFSYHLTVPFPGWFGQWTSIMAGIYLVGFAAPAFEQATSHVGEAINPNKSVPQAIFASAAMAGLYFIVLPVVWLGVLGQGPLSGDLSSELGPTFAPLFGAAAKGVAAWFIIFNMFHGILAPLAGPPRVLSQLADDGLLPEFMSKRLPSDAPWVTTLLTAAMAIAFLFIGDPIWLVAAANLTYLIGIAMPNVAVWLMRRNHPEMERPYRAPHGTIVLGLLAAIGWLTTTVFGFEQFGLKTVIIGIAFAYAGSILYAWRKMSDNKKMGLPILGHTLHLKLTGSMILVLALDAIGYFIAVSHVPTQDISLITMLEDIFVIVALLTIAVGLILPGMIAHTAVEISNAAEKLVQGTLADFTRAMRALAAGDLVAAKADFKLVPVIVHSHDEISEMAINFNKLQEEIGFAAVGLEGAREGLLKSQTELTKTNELLRIAEKRFAQEQIERMRNEHTIVLGSVIEGVHWLDANGIIKYENPASAKMLGYEVAELIGKPAHLTMHHTHADGSVHEQTQCPIYATLKDGAVRRVKDDVFWRKDGTSFPVDYTCTPIFGDNGKPEGCVVLFTDITERKKAEEIESANKKLTMMYEMQKDFTSTVSHELRTPLASIKTAIDLVVKRMVGEINPEQDEVLGRAKSNVDRLKRLIDDILDLTKIESGKVKMTFMMNDLHQVIEEVVESQRDVVQSRGLYIKTELGAQMHKIPFDSDRIIQVLNNLLGNAIKFTKQGGIMIRTKDYPQENCIFVSIRDTGKGINEMDLLKLFQKFQQIESAHENEEGGTGLGLAICKEIILRHGGKIWAESKPGEGTAFNFLLPIQERRVTS